MAFVFELKVVPQSGKQGLHLDKTGRLRCFLKSAPEKGRANRELVKFISQMLKVPQRDVEIVSGLTDRKKRIRVSINLSYEQFLQQLGLAQQQKLF